MSSPLSEQIKPWYRYGLVWFLISIPASAVIVGSAYFWVSVKMGDSLVADDYYREGRAINQRLEKDAEAVRRGIRITPELRPSGSLAVDIRVLFQAPAEEPRPGSIRLRMSHPTIDHLDVIATLMPAGPNHYETRIPPIAPGRWYVQLEDDQALWRVKSTWILEKSD